MKSSRTFVCSSILEPVPAEDALVVRLQDPQLDESNHGRLLDTGVRLLSNGNQLRVYYIPVLQSSAADITRVLSAQHIHLHTLTSFGCGYSQRLKYFTPSPQSERNKIASYWEKCLQIYYLVVLIPFQK